MTAQIRRLSALLLTLLFLPTALLAQDAVFEVDALNTGLPAPNGDIDLLTPQTAIETFIFAAEDGDYATAAHVLNLNDIDVGDQATRGPELARMLATVIDRKVVISWQSLLERPDSLDAAASSDSPVAGKPRKSLLISVLELEGRAVALRLNRVKPKDGVAVWVFSRQTVDRIEPLFARYGPSVFEKSLPDVLRQDAVLGLKWWEIIGLPIFFLLAGLLSLATWKLFGALARMNIGDLLSGILKGLRLPATIFVLAITVSLSTNYVFIVSGGVSNLLEPLLVLAFVTAAMILAINVIDAFLARIIDVDLEKLSSPDEEDRRNLATTVSAARRIAVVIAVLVGTGLILTTTKLFQTMGFSLLAAAGSLTLVLGFAAREVLGNILASLQISLNRSARVGDQLVYDGNLCTVERIHFTFVQLKVWDDTRLIVPVSKFITDEFVNRNIMDSGMTRHLTLTLSNNVDLKALRGAFEDFVQGDDRVDGESDAIEALVTGQNEYGLTIRFAVPVPDPRDGWDVECQLREHLITFIREQERDRGKDLLPHLGTSGNSGLDGDEAEDDAA